MRKNIGHEEYWEAVSDVIEALRALQEAGGVYPGLSPLLAVLEADLQLEADWVRFQRLLSRVDWGSLEGS